MKKSYAVVVTVVALVLVCSSYALKGPGYPVYDGEKLFKTDTYPYTIVFFGDSSPERGKEPPEVFKDIIQMINKDDPLFVVGGGDFVTEGTSENFEAFLETVLTLNPPLFYVCGNHDDSEYYEQYLGERVYALEYQNSLFVILDNSKKLLDRDQLEFLEIQLKRGFEHTFVLLHIPPFDPEGTHCMMKAEEFMEILLKYEVDYVLSSHIHTFYEEKIGKTTFIISGGAGEPLHRNGFNHYIRVEVGESITFEVVRCQ